MIRLDHYAIGAVGLRIVGSGRMPRDAPPAAGPIWARGPWALRGSCGPTPAFEPPAAWPWVPLGGPKAELDIRADKRTSA